MATRPLTRRARDAAGNVSATVSDTVTVDSTPPGAPVVSSSTHPDQATWYSVTDADFAFPATDSGTGVAGYSDAIGTSLVTIPDATVDTTASTLSAVAMAEGMQYLHARVVDAVGNMGAAAHFAVMFDTESPDGPLALESGATHATTCTIDADSSGVTDDASHVEEMKVQPRCRLVALEAVAAIVNWLLTRWRRHRLRPGAVSRLRRHVHEVFDTIVLDTSSRSEAWSLTETIRTPTPGCCESTCSSHRRFRDALGRRKRMVGVGALRA